MHGFAYICVIHMLSLNTVVLTSRECQGKLWLPKKCAPKNLKTMLSQKTVHTCIGTTLPRLKIDLKSLKTCLEWSYRILKIFETIYQFFICRPTVRPTNARPMGPVLSTRKVLFVRNTDLLFEEGLSTASSCFLSSFEVQSSSRMVRNNKLITATCT